MSEPWPTRAASARTPSVLYHATTPRKLARYVSTGTILPPVRGFDTRDAAAEWARLTGRSIILRIEPSDRVHLLPDHHNRYGLAWWTLAIRGWTRA